MLLEACDENSELIGQLLRGDVIHRGRSGVNVLSSCRPALQAKEPEKKADLMLR